MTRRRQSILLVAITALLVASFGGWIAARRVHRRAAVELAAATAEKRQLERATREAQKRAEVAERTRLEASEILAALRATTSTPTAEKPSPEKPAAAPRLRTMSEIIAGSPALAVIELERQRAAANQEYNRLYRQLGLSPEQIAKFRENCVKSAETWMDLKAAARAQDEAGQSTIAELQAKATADYEAAQAALLGPDGFRRLQEYSRTIPAYNTIVRGLAGAAAFEGVPLTPDQGEQLLAATIAASRGATSRGYLDLGALDWDALDRQARQILTPAQFALFKNVEAPSGFQGRWRHQLDAAIKAAWEAERAVARPLANTKSGG